MCDTTPQTITRALGTIDAAQAFAIAIADAVVGSPYIDRPHHIALPDESCTQEGNTGVIRGLGSLSPPQPVSVSFEPMHVDLPSPQSSVILRGDNSGGKTTLLRTVLQAAWLRQITGVAPAIHFSIAPIDGIWYHAVSPALSISSQSSWLTECSRLNEMVSHLFSAGLTSPGPRWWVAIDEIGRGTDERTCDV